MDRRMDSLSWERGSFDDNGLTDREELLVFGYSAKLFKDEEQARLVDEGRHLVPCQGREDVRIDRFDVRGCLSGLQSVEPAEKVEMTPEELDLERKLDDERFRDLISDEVVDAQEEEIRRLREELASDGAYNQVSFKYESDGSNGDAQQQVNDFQVPDGLTLPLGLNLPKTMKDHFLMERTAVFIHKNGPQMEIVLKIKQSSNPAFSFLNFDSPLNPYFRYLLSVIRTGKYAPKEKAESKEVVAQDVIPQPDSDSDDDDDGGGYLHPSLMGGTKSSVIPRLETNSGHESLSLKQKPDIRDPGDTSAGITVSVATPSVSHVASVPKQGESKPSKFSILPPPPADLEKIIDKLAEKVAQAGEEFESSIKRRADPRFEFLNPGNCFHAHYVRRKLHHIEENQKRVAESRQNAHKSGRSISFSFIKARSRTEDDEKGGSDRTDASSAAPEPPVEAETVSREKRIQEERKKKVAAFLSLMKRREEAEKEEGNDEQNKEQEEQDRHNDGSSSRTSGHSSSDDREKRKRENSRHSSSRHKKHRSHARSPSVERSPGRRRSRSRRSRSRSRSR